MLGAAPLAGALASSGTTHVLATTGPVELVSFYRSPRHLQSVVPTVVHRRAVVQRAVHAVAAAPSSSSATESARVSVPAAATIAPRDLSFQWPAQGTVTTPFIPSGPLRHDGIDIADLRSLTVVAADSGRVVHVGYTPGFEGYGNIIDVEPEPGVQVLYAHLAAMDVQVGDEVQAGQVIATAGCTGRCYGTHLHFEVRIDGTPVNPVPFLR